MKKLWGILCMAALLLCTGTQAFAAGNPTLTVGTVTAEAGKSITVPIDISGNTGICGAEIAVSYDKALTLTAVAKGTGWSSLTLTKPGDLIANPVNLIWDSTEADFSNGTVATLTFTAPKTSGTYSVSVSYENGDIVDGDINPVTVNIVNGAVKVGSQTPEVPKTPVTEVFSDVVAGSWYVDAVQYVYDNGIMSGSAGLFSPNNSVTRSMVVETLYKMEGKPAVSDFAIYDQYTDLDRYQWWANSVSWAMNLGIATGDNYYMKFKPETAVTREQLATFLYRYAKYKNLDVTLSKDASAILGGAYVNSYARDAFAWAVDIGLISGVESNGVKDLNSQGVASRAQMAAIMQRLANHYKDI